jgi:predicted  nucleic acid-binding Zn ribbon protein
MYTYDVIFKSKSDIEIDDFDCAISDLFCKLSGNNQIIFETENLSILPDRSYVMRVATPFLDSLDHKYDNAYVRKFYQKIFELSVSEPEYILIGEDATFNDDSDTESGADSYVLKIHLSLEDLFPVVSCKNRGYIPRYLFPEISDNLSDAIDRWHTNFTAFDKLFYSTNVGEMMAHKMLSNVNSQLNINGRNVALMLETEVKKPVYYFLYKFYGKLPKKCPICGEEWRSKEQDVIFDYKCDQCRLVADKTMNES